MMRWNQQHRRRTETPWQGGEPGQNRTNRLFPCDLHPANTTKYTFYCLVACQASAPDMAKAVLPYQCIGTSSCTIRTSSHAHHQLTNTITFLWCLETGQNHLVSRREHVHHLIGKQKPYIGWPVSFWRLTRKTQESILQLNHQPSSEKISVGVGRGHHKPVKMNQQGWRSTETNIHSGMRTGSRWHKLTDLTHQPIQPSQAEGHKIPSLKG